MPQSAEVRRERRARDFAAEHGEGARKRPRGPAPTGFPNWDAITGVWRNADGEAASAASRKREQAALRQTKARSKNKQFGTHQLCFVFVILALYGFLIHHTFGDSQRALRIVLHPPGVLTTGCRCRKTGPPAQSRECGTSSWLFSFGKLYHRAARRYCSPWLCGSSLELYNL